jgi:FlaA1/EpsC-like NDP-sugar epimerase
MRAPGRIWFYTKQILTVLLDAVLINVAMYVALYLRFDTPHVPAAYLDPYLRVAPVFTLGTLAVLFLFRIYHRLWQYASARDGQVLAVAITLSAVLLAGLIYASGGAHYPRAVFALYWLLALVLVGGVRFLRRSLTDWRLAPPRQERPRVLILGAGKAGQLVAQELARHPESGQALGFLDDDEQKQGMQIGSLRVLGRLSDLAEVVAATPVDQLIIAMPSVGGAVVRAVVEEARRLRIRTRIVAGLNQMIEGQVRVEQIRDVQIEDLLQRNPARIDLGEIASYLTGRRVWVTGAGGTIGSEIARHVARFNPAELVLLGLDETDVFEVHRHLVRDFPEVTIVPWVGDLRDAAHVERLVRRRRPQVIFHAAAHKHVPLMEAQPDEAVRNNVGALLNLAALADRYRVETFVFISTDKAVNPTSVYGATKRVGELLVQAFQHRSTTRFVAVRFGNVLGSRGSVVPIFQEQIRSGGPVTVTHPEMVRYFMTAAEAAQLVIQAGAMGQGGEIFVLDMGEPIRILDLAQNLIRLSGLVPGEDIDIVFTGVRPGEKLYEEPLTRKDRSRASRHERIFVAPQDPVDAQMVLKATERLLAVAEAGQPEAVVRALAAMVPEYRPNRAEGAAPLAVPAPGGGQAQHAVEP